jgi:MFS family permease
MVAAMVWLMQPSSLWMLYIFAIAFGIAYGGLSPSTTAMVSDSFGTRHIGSIMGVLEIGWVLGAAAGPVLAGYIFDTTHKYFLAFLFVAIAALILAILIPFIKAPKAKKEDEY